MGLQNPVCFAGGTVGQQGPMPHYLEMSVASLHQRRAGEALHVELSCWRGVCGHDFSRLLVGLRFASTLVSKNDLCSGKSRGRNYVCSGRSNDEQNFFFGPTLEGAEWSRTSKLEAQIFHNGQTRDIGRLRGAPKKKVTADFRLKKLPSLRPPRPYPPFSLHAHRPEKSASQNHRVSTGTALISLRCG